MSLQVMPAQNAQQDDFDHLAMLTETIKTEELLTLPANEVLWRLYHEEEVTVYDPQDVEFKCTCSRERCADALKTLPMKKLIASWRKMAKLTCIVITAVTTICSMRWILLKSQQRVSGRFRKFINVCPAEGSAGFYDVMA